MSTLESLMLAAAIPGVLVLLGYWLAARIAGLSAAERLSVALLAGLCVALWSVSVTNLVLPLAGIWGWVCLLPAVGTLAPDAIRTQLAHDLRQTVLTRRGAIVVLGSAAFVGGLLWPLLSRSEVILYDGSASHDAFFWITGAEHLKRWGYLLPPVSDPASPLYASVSAIVGLRPPWGRMGAEGLLALVSNLAGASPLKIYLAATAALFFPWVAAVYLVIRTVVLRRITGLALVALVALQPLFVFFHANANLPNLIGVLCTALLLVAVHHLLRTSPQRRGWRALAALALHGLLCSYPEMIPAVAPACALFVVRALGRGPRRHGWQVAGAVAGVTALGVLLNPFTAARAWNGFLCSLDAVQTPERYPDIFASVAGAARPAAMTTLSVPLGHDLGTVGGWLAAVVLALALVIVIRRARDPLGTVALLTGILVMMAYTLHTHFGYGWQKSVQFSGAYLAALLPCGALAVLTAFPRRSPRPWAPLALAAALAGVFGYATAANLRETYKWSERKVLTRDWFALREFARTSLRNRPVRVETGGFSRPFFYSMWATYFLAESRVSFPDHEDRSGGYLYPAVARQRSTPIPPPRAIVAGADWKADAGFRPQWAGNGIVVVAAPYRPGR